MCRKEQVDERNAEKVRKRELAGKNEEKRRANVFLPHQFSKTSTAREENNVKGYENLQKGVGCRI